MVNHFHRLLPLLYKAINACFYFADKRRHVKQEQ